MLGKYLKQNNKTAVANLMLDVLIQPHQEVRPDEQAWQLASESPRIIAYCFNLLGEPSNVSPLRDNWLARPHWGTWAGDLYLVLLSIAYALGPTRANLPFPFSNLVPAFQLIGGEFTKLFQAQAKAELAARIQEDELARREQRMKEEERKREAERRREEDRNKEMTQIPELTRRIAELESLLSARSRQEADQETQSQQERQARLQKVIEAIRQEAKRENWPAHRLQRELEFAQKQSQMEE